MAETRRAEDQSGRNLTHDGRLSELAKEHGKNSRRYDNDDQLEQDPKEQFLDLHSPGGCGEGKHCRNSFSGIKKPSPWFGNRPA